MTEYEERQITESIKAYQNVIRYIEEQIKNLQRQRNQDKNFEYKFNITKK
jgi:hypothetical protein